METTFALDWVSGTFKGKSDKKIRQRLGMGVAEEMWVPINGMHAYTWGLQHPNGTIVLGNPDRPEMGTHVMMGGAALKAITDAGIDPVSVLKWLVDQKCKISRLDLAIDVYGVPFNLATLAGSKQVKGAEGSTKKWSNVRDSDGGQTVYCGSRKSDKFLRIYDKAAQMKLDGLIWTRFEIELHRDTAREIAAQVAALPPGEIPHFVKGLIKGMFNPELDTFQAAMDAPAVSVPSTKDTGHRTIEWLLNSVAKTMARQMSAHRDIDLWNDFAGMVQENLRAIGYSPFDK